MARAECRACGEFFSSTGAFDMHRTGSYGNPIYNQKKQVIGYTKHERRCLTPQEMLDKAMAQNSQGIWITGTFDASVFSKSESEIINEQ
jgi:hypothetical protein